jgi:hypothetical protein
MDELPADESAARKLLAPPSRGVLIGGIAGLALLLLGGLAAFFLWPSSKTARPVATPAPAPATTTTTTTPATRQRSPATQVVNYVYLRQPVYYRTTHPVGTMIVDKSQNFLYVVRPNVVAIRWANRPASTVDARYPNNDPIASSNQTPITGQWWREQNRPIA